MVTSHLILSDKIESERFPLNTISLRSKEEIHYYQFESLSLDPTGDRTRDIPYPKRTLNYYSTEIINVEGSRLRRCIEATNHQTWLMSIPNGHCLLEVVSGLMTNGAIGLYCLQMLYALVTQCMVKQHSYKLSHQKPNIVDSALSIDPDQPKHA